MTSFLASAVKVDEIQLVSTKDKVGKAKIAVDEAISMKLSFLLDNTIHVLQPDFSVLIEERVVDDAEC